MWDLVAILDEVKDMCVDLPGICHVCVCVYVYWEDSFKETFIISEVKRD